MSRFALFSIGYGVILIRMALSGPVGRSGLEFCLLYAGAFAGLYGMVRCFPDKWNDRQTLVFVAAVGILGRMLFLGFPVSFDVHRYVWEGFVQTQGINPYLEAPASPALKPLITGEAALIWEAINHKDLAAGYPPLAQLVFRSLASLSLSPLLFKTVLTVLDALVLIPLTMLFQSRGIPLVRLLWYAGNPLALVFIAGEGHLDSLMVLLLCAGVALILTTPRVGLGFFLVGCAGMAKYFAWAALPFLVRRDNWRRLWPAFLPLLLFGLFGEAGTGLFTSIGTFAAQYHYNDSVTVLLRWVLGADSLVAALIVMAAGGGCIWWVEHDRMRSAALALGLLLICLPTLHPWYLLLIAPFAAAYASPAWLVLQVSVVFTFPVLIHEYQTGIFSGNPLAETIRISAFLWPAELVRLEIQRGPHQALSAG